jgi:hypothetical protein
MRSVLPVLLTLWAGFGFATAAAAEPRLTWADPGLPLQELRPNDRRVYILTLEGKWNEPFKTGVAYYVNVLFPTGGGFANRVEDESLLAKGVVRCVLQEHKLACSSGQFFVVLSARRAVCSTSDEDVVSNPLALNWPMNRPIQKLLPPSRHAESEPVDRFVPPGDALPPPKVEKPPMPRKER